MVARMQNVVIAAFTEEQASRLSGVSPHQLRYWSRDSFLVPSLAMKGEGGPSLRLYSFRDLVSLKVLNSLRNDAKIPLYLLRTVKERLAHLGDDMWAKTTLYVLGKRVVFDNPETGEKEDVANGQGVLQIPLKVVTGDMEVAVREMRKRESGSSGRIDTKRSGVKNPVIAGTRVPVMAIKDFAEAGYTFEQIIQQYPSLTEGDIEAAIKYERAA
jgi:DNA-binding transcriptional MerR regulator